MGNTRIYLTGRIAVESERGAISDLSFSDDVDRVGLALLVLERRRPVAPVEIAEAIWVDRPARRWQATVGAALDRLESGLGQNESGLVLERGNDVVTLRSPTDLWVDLEHAHRSLERASAAMRAGDQDQVLSACAQATVIGKRPFLPGIESDWATSHQKRHKQVLVDGLLLWAEVEIARGAAKEAIRLSQQALDHEPLHEPGIRMLMRAMDSAGNRAGALEAFDEFRLTLARAHGTEPAGDTLQLADTLRTPSIADLDPLTPREREVAGLLAEALTNRQIAERLFISIQTVETHVKRILLKLGLSSRTQVAARVARRPERPTEG